MPPKRKEKKLPPYLEQLSPLPDCDTDLDAHLVAFCRRQEELRDRYHALFEDLRQEFENTKNPLFAWDCYALCRRENKPVPLWVFEYLDSVAFRMMSKDSNPRKLPDILGFTEMRVEGKRASGKAWAQYLSYTTGREVAASVARYLRENPGEKIQEACKKIYNDSKTRFAPWYAVAEIEKWYKKYFS